MFIVKSLKTKMLIFIPQRNNFGEFCEDIAKSFADKHQVSRLQ